MAEPTYLVIDIETVPDRQLHTPAEPSPGLERPFPPLYACKPVVIGAMWLSESLGLKRLCAVGDGKDEAGILSDFADFMTARRPHLVTWNGRGFDLPVLTLRSLRYGISWPWYYRDRDYRYRYSEEGHLDLCDFLSDHGAARMTPLDGVSRLIGLPGKDGIDGSQVEGLFNAGQTEALRRYCLSDVTQTAFVFLRYRLLVGALDLEGYRRVASDLLAAVAADPCVSRIAEGVDRQRLLLTSETPGQQLSVGGG